MSKQTSDIVVFPSYSSKVWRSPLLGQIRIWEAARATSAATSFFEPLEIDGQIFADGATGANNPIYEIWAEASSLFSPPADEAWRLENHLRCLVSIGTGVPSLKPFGPGIGEVAAALKAIATDSEAKAQQFQRLHSPLVKKGAVFRFNVQHGLEDVGLEEASRLGDIEAATDRYCSTQAIAQQLEDCAIKLRQRFCKQNLFMPGSTYPY